MKYVVAHGWVLMALPRDSDAPEPPPGRLRGVLFAPHTVSAGYELKPVSVPNPDADDPPEAYAVLKGGFVAVPGDAGMTAGLCHTVGSLRQLLHKPEHKDILELLRGACLDDEPE